LSSLDRRRMRTEYRGLFVVMALMLSNPRVGAADMYPTLDRLVAEGAAFEAASPAEWREYGNRILRVFEDNRALRTQSAPRQGHPPPDLRPLQVPLPRLVVDLLNLKPDPSGYSFEDLKFHAYVEAIVEHRDNRRIGVLLEYRDKAAKASAPFLEPDDWDRIVGRAAPEEWAVDTLPNLLSGNPRLWLRNLPYTLLYRFAETLPQALRDAGYGYIRSQVKTGPGDWDTESYWKLLVRLDATRACDELIGYFGKRDANNLSIVLLLDPLTPNPKIAAAARKWLPSLHPFYSDLYGDYLRRWLVRDDPSHYLTPTLKRIDALLSGSENSSRTDGAERLIRAILTIDSERSRQGLARYANNRRLGVLSDVRRQIVLQLGRHRYSGLPAIVGRWLRDDWDENKSWLRSLAIQEWGEYGRTLLSQAERGAK
jgi:hypothetical protein